MIYFYYIIFKKKKKEIKKERDIYTRGNKKKYEDNVAV